MDLTREEMELIERIRLDGTYEDLSFCAVCDGMVETERRVTLAGRYEGPPEMCHEEESEECCVHCGHCVE